MKKIYYVISFIIVLLLIACGRAGTDNPPSAYNVKSDIEEYMQEVIDNTAKLLECEVTDETEGDKSYIVTADVFYEDNTGKNRSKFSLTYDWSDDAWKLVKCRMAESELVDGHTEVESDSDSPDSYEMESGQQEDMQIKEERQSDNQDSNSEQSDKAGVQSVLEDMEEMSDDLYDFTFSLDNVVYKLPFPLTKLKENGWEYDENTYPDDDKIPANSRYTIHNVRKNGMSFTAYVINMSGNTKNLIDCKVGGIDISWSSLKDEDAFFVAKGIKVSSSEEEVISAYGEASDVLRDDITVELTYYVSAYVNYCFRINKNDLNSIRIINYVADESDETDTSEEIQSTNGIR